MLLPWPRVLITSYLETESGSACPQPRGSWNPLSQCLLLGSLCAELFSYCPPPPCSLEAGPACLSEHPSLTILQAAESPRARVLSTHYPCSGLAWVDLKFVVCYIFLGLAGTLHNLGQNEGARHRSPSAPSTGGPMGIGLTSLFINSNDDIHIHSSQGQLRVPLL
jgi:hypothetical protein